MLHGSSSVMGLVISPDYVAPEVLVVQRKIIDNKVKIKNSKKKISRATDWWTFGVLIYEMLYDVLPFSCNTPQETLKKIVKEEIIFPHNEYISKNAINFMKS